MKRKSNGTPLKEKRRRSAILETCHINQKYFEDSFKESFRQGLQGCSPFPNWQIRNFIDNSDNFVERLEEELQNFEEWKRKENDLYSLYQTDDLKSISPLNYPKIFAFRQFLQNEARCWLQNISGIELIDQVDCNGSCYSQTDSLLPHNDLIETRRFAFVYYLTCPNWNPKTNGGNLQLFNSDKHSIPTTISVELVPLRNSLNLFEVSEKSWHRVAEIISDDPRLSINGWFHSTRRIEPKKPKAEKIPRFIPENKAKLSNYLNMEYLKKERQDEVQQLFADNSELNLSNFLVNDLHNAVYEELSKNSKIDESQIGEFEKSKKLYNMLKSKNIVSFLGKISGVTLTGAESSIRVSRIQHGSYWVIGDEDAEQSTNDGYCLDFHIFVQKNKWVDSAGGDLIYIAEGEQEELLRIEPNPNCGSLVFREPGVFPFLKFANCRSTDPFFLFSVSFYNVQVVDD
ncbi:unnamed protein product [Caenorhabditis angaria]|uniref:uS12 prolyl 3-hydroxylase n=1 Tax=Caenorhabditis angaria TaxID=860376 RepID=A0A9P1MYK1_9PELO|nr:unnamed protein product [Caenorhabditis angaria]